MRERRFDIERFCPDRRDDIVTYIFGEMGPGAAEAFEAHVASCAGCRDEVRSLDETLRFVAEARPSPGGALPADGDGVPWDQEWALLRRRLLASDVRTSEPARARSRVWLARAAAVSLTAGLAFAAGYLWRGSSTPPSSLTSSLDGRAAPPVAGAARGNYFDNLDDFERDTHNFLRRTRMVLIEFTNLDADSDPAFFREACADLLAEVERYREVSRRMQNRKLGDLLDQIAGILAPISRVEQARQAEVAADVRTTLNLTGLIATLELLDANIERDLKGQPNV